VAPWKTTSFAAILGLALSAGAAPPASAGPRDLAAIDAQCQGAMRQTATVCACVVGRASSVLNDIQQRYVAAAFTNDQAAMAQIQTSMSQADVAGIGQFMGTTLPACGVTR
jgi:hypothetical protein